MVFRWTTQNSKVLSIWLDAQFRFSVNHSQNKSTFFDFILVSLVMFRKKLKLVLSLKKSNRIILMVACKLKVWKLFDWKQSGLWIHAKTLSQKGKPTINRRQKKIDRRFFEKWFWTCLKLNMPIFHQQVCYSFIVSEKLFEMRLFIT